MRRYVLEVNENGKIYIFRDHILMREFGLPSTSDFSREVEMALDCLYCLFEHDGVIPEVPAV